MRKEHIIQSPAGEFVMFASSDGSVRVECRFEKRRCGFRKQLSPICTRLHLKPLRSISRQFTKKAHLNKTQPVSLTYKFKKKALVR
ncbi:hypothetical protein EDF84_105239 [Erwinia rhapontici]|nr:hypothetical protein EDF84_105239 [Erwinia rhapontici]